MWQYAAKAVVTIVLVIAISEIGKRSSSWGAILASLPITSLLAFVWHYTGTGNAESVAKLSHGIFWLVLASLPLFHQDLVAGWPLPHSAFTTPAWSGCG